MSDYTLWSLFQEDFTGWTSENIKTLRNDTRAKLRLHLLKRGVYVPPYNNRYPILDALFATLNEEEQHEWTDQELVKILKIVRPMITVAPRDRLNSTLTGLGEAQVTAHSTPDQSVAQPSQRTQPAQFAQPTSVQGQQQGQQPPVQQSQSQPQYTPTATSVSVPHPPLAQPATRSTSYGKEVSTVAKIYTDDQKYSGVDSFDFKLTIFYDICNRSSLPPEGYMTAFPTILKGLAQAHYYNCSLSSKSFDGACAHIRNFFEGPEYYRKNLTEWNAITLQGFMNENPEKSVGQCFQLLIDKLCKHQKAIDIELRTPRILTNKVATACQGVPACRIAISKSLRRPGYFSFHSTRRYRVQL